MQKNLALLFFTYTFKKTLKQLSLYCRRKKRTIVLSLHILHIQRGWWWALLTFNFIEKVYKHILLLVKKEMIYIKKTFFKKVKKGRQVHACTLSKKSCF